MARVAPAAVVAAETPESSAAVADRVVVARERQLARSGALNGTLAGRSLRAACRLTAPVAARAVELAELEGLSARGTERLLRVARTVADLAGVASVGRDALDEAARYRSPSRVLDRRMSV